jgi:hypothetical protein
MDPDTDPSEEVVARQVFPAWSITIPASFAEAFVDEGGYWHAWDDHRSVSLASLALTDERGPVPVAAIARQLPPLDGTPIDALPAGLPGRAVEGDAIQPARASRVLSGMLAADGRVLIVTITSDDHEWTRRTWLSISRHPAALSDAEGRDIFSTLTTDAMELWMP